MVAMLLKVRNMFSVELAREFEGGRNPKYHRTPRRINSKIDMNSLAPTLYGTDALGLFLAVESVMMPFSMGI